MKKLIVLLVTVFLIAFVSGIAFARLTSVQKILNDVWSDSDNALQVTISL